ncbi:hypothetical protein Sulfitobl28_33150 (plasmid) [Sulfitobacter pontiacus]|nr:hypothetical protein Sulfitobl28_33150 [Sulfitobacter pontiacus]
MAVFAQTFLLRGQHLDKAHAVAFFFSDLNMDFCALVIEHPMQWPSRLNLHTSMQGLGVFTMGNLAD